MTLDDLEAEFRHLSGDRVANPYLFSRDDIRTWLNQAEDEATTRADLLREADNPRMCAIPIALGQAAWTLNSLWLRISRAWFIYTTDAGSGCDQEHPLEIIVDRRTLDERRRHWRTTSETPREILIEGSRARLGCVADAAGTVYLEGWRLPGKKMKEGKDEPEIDLPHHLFLVQWALKKAFDRPDTETRDPDRSAKADAAFTAYFGPPRDSDLGQALEQVPAFNRAY